MANISYDKICIGEFYNNISANEAVQDKIFNQLKLKTNGT